MLEACGLRYLVGGSLASSMSGEPRSTLDVDIVVAMSESDIDRRGTEVHVPLRRGEIHLTGELLNGSRRCAAHREV